MLIVELISTKWAFEHTVDYYWLITVVKRISLHSFLPPMCKKCAALVFNASHMHYSLKQCSCDNV